MTRTKVPKVGKTRNFRQFCPRLAIDLSGFGPCCEGRRRSSLHDFWDVRDGACSNRDRGWAEQGNVEVGCFFLASGTQRWPLALFSRRRAEIRLLLVLDGLSAAMLPWTGAEVPAVHLSRVREADQTRNRIQVYSCVSKQAVQYGQRSTDGRSYTMDTRWG
jgi:hypothetical protein